MCFVDFENISNLELIQPLEQLHDKITYKYVGKQTVRNKLWR